MVDFCCCGAETIGVALNPPSAGETRWEATPARDDAAGRIAVTAATPMTASTQRGLPQGLMHSMLRKPRPGRNPPKGVKAPHLPLVRLGHLAVVERLVEHGLLDALFPCHFAQRAACGGGLLHDLRRPVVADVRIE